MDSDITVFDIVMMRKVIEMMSSRGAIQAQEMESIGQLYTKLTKVLEENKESPVP